MKFIGFLGSRWCLSVRYLLGIVFESDIFGREEKEVRLGRCIGLVLMLVRVLVEFIGSFRVKIDLLKLF